VNELLFLTDISQVPSIVRKSSQWLKRASLVTGDMTVAAELERLGIPFIDEWSFLKPEDIEDNWNKAHELADHWWDESIASTEYHGFSLAEAARQELVWPFEVCLNARTIYQRLLAAIPVKHIYGFFVAPVAIYNTGPSPTFRAATSVAQAVLRWTAKQSGLTVSGLRSLRRLSTEGRQWGPRRSHEGGSPLIQQGRFCHPVVLLLENGLESREPKVLEKGFADDGWAVVRVLATFDRLLDWSHNHNEISRKLQKAWNTLEVLQANYAGPHPELFGNPYLNFQFKRIWDGMLMASQLGDLYSSLLDTIRPSLVVLGHDAFTLGRTLVRAARRKGIPTAALIHGGFAHSAGFRGLVGDADYLMVWGKEDMRWLTKYSVSRDRLRAVGSLRYDQQYRVALSEGVERNSEPSQKEARRALRLPVEKSVILYLTASTNAGMAQPIANPAIHRATWRELVAFAARSPEFTFVIKPHPSYDHFEFYRHLRKHCPRNLVLLENADLETAILASNVAVMVNYATTAALEATLLNIPVTFLQTAIYQAAGREDTLPEHAVIRTGSVTELESVIKRLLSDDQYRKEIAIRSLNALTEVLGDNTTPALDRIMLEFKAVALSSTGDPEHLTDSEQDITGKLSATMRSLLNANDKSGFTAKWESLVDSLNPESPQMLGRVLYGLSFAIGSTASDGPELRRLVRESLQPLQPLPADQCNGVLLNAYLTAITKHADRNDWRQADSFARHALRHIPIHLIKSSLFRRLLVKSLSNQSRVALFVVNVKEWGTKTVEQARAPRYLEIV